jgi:hypothetical protein
LDIDYAANEDFRGIQFNPPGSEASIIFGKGITSALTCLEYTVYIIKELLLQYL